jgi:hypothetical protein
VLARKHGLIWGGNWGYPERFIGFHDLDHVQRCAIAQQMALFQLEWFPDAN